LPKSLVARDYLLICCIKFNSYNIQEVFDSDDNDKHATTEIMKGETDEGTRERRREVVGDAVKL